MNNSAVIGASIVLAAAGLGFTMLQTKEALAMEGQHWVMLLVILIAGYVAGRLFPQAGQMVGLP